jgi:hypothetical protein
MSKKASAPPRIAPLQFVVAELITDPVEQAALDKMRKRLKRKQGGRKAELNRDDAGTASKAGARKKG